MSLIEAETLESRANAECSHLWESCAAFLHDTTHQIVLYDTPKNAFWMNQVEIWLSNLARTLLKRGKFCLT